MAPSHATPSKRAARAAARARWHPVAAVLACLLCAGGVAASWQYARLAFYGELTTTRAAVTLQLDQVRGDLSRELFAALNLTDGLVSLVSLRGRVEPGEFDALAAAVLRRSAVVRNVALAPGTTIRYMFR